MQKRIYALLLLAQRFALRWPKVLLCIFAVLTLVLSSGLPHLQFLISIDDLIDPNFKTFQGLQTVNQQFKDKNTILMSVESQEVFEKKFLCDVQKWILDVTQKRSDLIQIQSTFGIRQAEIIGHDFRFKSFLDLDCLSSEPEKEKIREAFAEIQKSPWRGILTSLNDYSLTFNFVIFDPQDTKYGSIDTTVYGALKEDFEKHFPEKKAQTFWGGITTYQSLLKEAMDQTQAINMLMFLVGLLVFRIFLGSWTSGFVFNTTISVSMLWTYGFMGLRQIPVDVLTNSAGLILSVSCLEDFIFIAYGMMKYRWSLRKCLRVFLIPSFFTSVTTSLGFASLAAADLEIIQRIGLISSLGGMLEWAMVFLVLPAVLQLVPAVKNIKAGKPWLNVRNPVQKTLTKKQTWLALGLVGISILFWDRLRVKDSPEGFFAEDHYVNTTTQHFKDTRGWTNESTLLFRPENSDETNQQLIEEVRKLPGVFKVENSYEIKSYISARLDSPDKKMIERMWEDSWFAERLISRQGVLRAQVFVESMEAQDIQALSEKITSLCQQGQLCEFVGTLIAYNEFGDRVLKTLFKSLGISLILVALVMTFVRKPLGAYEIVACVLSSVWGALALLGLFVIFDIPVFFVTSICAAVLVGLAGDNAIHFIFSAKKGQLDSSIQSLEDASLIVTLSMCLMVLIFCLSPVVPLAKLGGLMLVGFALGYLGDIWILKGMLKK